MALRKELNVSRIYWDFTLVFLAVRGVMGELVSATAEPSFPVVTEICRDPCVF
jgi:hypothetical protein